MNPVLRRAFDGGRGMSWWQRRLILRMFEANLKPSDIEFIATVVYLAEKPPLAAAIREGQIRLNAPSGAEGGGRREPSATEVKENNKETN